MSPFRFQDKSDWHWLKGQGAEVINIGMIAQDSGGVRRIALNPSFSPKALLLYMGNNEALDCLLGCKERNSPLCQKCAACCMISAPFVCFLIGYSRCASVNRSNCPLKAQTEVLGRLTQTQWRAAGSALMAESGNRFRLSGLTQSF